MRRALLLGIILGSALLVGCAGEQEYTLAQRLFALRQYEEAADSAVKAVEKDPTNDKYRGLLKNIKTAAAREEYNRGLLLYSRNQLSQALLAFEKAVGYDASFEEASKAYDSVKERRDVIQKVISDIPSLIATDRPDAALDKLVEVQAYANDYPQIRDLTTRALESSTILHTKQGRIRFQEENFDDARKEFQIALNRLPGYSPAVQGLARSLAQLKAASLVAEGKKLLEAGDFSSAHAKFQEALTAVPGHVEAIAAISDAAEFWARSLYEQGRALEEAGGFDNLSEALRRYERAGALSERFSDTDERISELKKALAGEFLGRAEEYEQLGQDYLGLALVNFQMSLYCDPTQVEVSRRVLSFKEAFDNRRAFYIDIRSTEESSIGTSFSRQLTQALKKAVISSGIKDLYVVAPFSNVELSAGMPEGGLAGRHLTIFTSHLGEEVVVKGENRPEVVRSTYKVGTRPVPNPAFDEARRTLNVTVAEEKRQEQELERLRGDLDRTTDPDERDALRTEIDFQRNLLEDAQDKTIDIQSSLADTPEWTQEEVYSPYDYMVYTVTMDAKVEVSLEVADPYRGSTRTLEVISGTASGEDTYNDGVKATDTTGAQVNPKELPTQSELLAEARQDTADKSVAWLEGTLTQLSMQYYNRAKELEEIGNAEGAAEYFYAFYLSVPDKSTPEAIEALQYVRNQTHLISEDEKRPTAGGKR